MNTPSTTSIPESNEHCQGSVVRDCGHPFSRLVRFWTSKSCQTRLSTFTITPTEGRAEDDILLAFNFNTFLHTKTADNLKFASLWTKISLFVCFGKQEVSETIFPTV
jgi:hypothetical protein